METTSKNTITISADINAPVKKVWEFFIKPEHIVKWNNASDEWHTPKAENDVRKGGKFVYRMEAKDGSVGFDFGGTYENVEENKILEYILEDGRKATVKFAQNDDKTKVEEIFDAEDTNPAEVQKTGWQNILDNFKKYTEAN